MSKSGWIIVLVVALAGLAYWIFGSRTTTVDQAPSDQTTEVSNTMPAGEGTNVDEMLVGGDVEVSVEGVAVGEPNPSTSKVVEVTVEGKNFSFAPNKLSAKVGDTVRVTFKNMDGFHDFVIDEFKVATKQIQAGQSETVEFVADKAGTFEYYCSVGAHRANGMKGNLIVE